MTAKEISILLANDTESVCRALFPNGKRVGSEWCVGSIAGEAGDSLKVKLCGNKAGVWSDFAVGGKGGDLIDLYSKLKSVPLAQAIRWAKEWLGMREEFSLTPKPKPFQPLKVALKPVVSPEILAWFRTREIHPDSLKAYRVTGTGALLALPSYIGDHIFAVKYRDISKPKQESMRVEPNAMPCLFGWQAIPPNAREVVLTEGELDAIAYGQQGIPALSIPFGAGKGEKQKWIEYEWERLEHFDTIYLSMDMDIPGQETAPYLAERLGNHRCRLVDLPCKDANDTIKEFYELAPFLATARYCDPPEIKEASSFLPDVKKLFNRTDDQKGDYLPWSKTNHQFRLRSGETTLWSGSNGHGKSLVLSHVAASLIHDGGKVCIASMEMRSPVLLMRLFQQIGAVNQPSDSFLDEMNEWIATKLWLVNIYGTAKAEKIIQLGDYAVKRFGVTHYMIDSLAKCGFAEDDYNGQKTFVDQITDLAHRTNIHIHLVAHTRKGEDEYRIANKMDVKGTGAITDMVENVACVWRNKSKEEAIENNPELAQTNTSPDCIIQVQKQRNYDWEGKIALWFDRDSHQYVESFDGKPRGYVTI